MGKTPIGRHHFLIESILNSSSLHPEQSALDEGVVSTTLQISVPVLECNVKKSGLAHALSRIHASGIPVLELEADPHKAVAENNQIAIGHTETSINQKIKDSRWHRDSSTFSSLSAASLQFIRASGPQIYTSRSLSCATDCMSSICIRRSSYLCV